MAAFHLFNFLNKSKSPQHKLKDAIITNNTEKLKELLDQGTDPNMVLEKASGNRAIHLAATYGYYRVIEQLANAGAICDMPNESGVTAIFNAVRFKHPLAIQVLFKHCGGVTGLDQLWFDGNFVQQIVSRGIEVVLPTLIISTPNLRMSRFNLWSNILRLCLSFVPHYEGVKLLFLTGYTYANKDFVQLKLKIIKRLQCFQSGDDGSRLTSVERMEVIDSLTQTVDFISKLTKNPLTLKHCCRLTVRSCFHEKCNVYFGAEHLPLPRDLKRYLVFYQEP